MGIFVVFSFDTISLLGSGPRQQSDRRTVLASPRATTRATTARPGQTMPVPARLARAPRSRLRCPRQAVVRVSESQINHTSAPRSQKGIGSTDPRAETQPEHAATAERPPPRIREAAEESVDRYAGPDPPIRRSTETAPPAPSQPPARDVAKHSWASRGR